MLNIDSTTDTPEAIKAAGEPEAVVKTSVEPADDAATETEEGDSETPEAEQDEKPKKKGGFQKRIAELVREKAELAKQLADKTAVKPAEEIKPAAAPADKPKAENFDTYDAYIEALTDWKVDQTEKTKAKAEADKRAAADASERGKAWEKSVELAKARYEDYDEVLAGAHAMPISQAMHNTIVESGDDGPQLAYWLAQHPDEVTRIAKLSPFAAAKELGKIVATFDGEEDDDSPADKQPKATKAPEPIAPVGRKSSKTSVQPDQMSYQDFKRWREKTGAR
jgi:hypothetical protein